MSERVDNTSSQTTGCLKIAPLKLLGIFSLPLSLFVWHFANLLAIHIHIYLPIFEHFILKFHQMALIFPWVLIVFTMSSFWVLNARTWRENHHFQWYPNKGWKLGTVQKVCSRVDHTISAVLRKPDSGTGRPVTASACAVCRFKTIFPLVGPTKF